MTIARLNITLPEELVVELNQIVGPRRKSRFIASTIRDRLNELRAERLREKLAEGYWARNQESSDLAKEFEAVDLEGWDEN
jgi:metal-responsive CopG/Arc/MetJ family transcriptional regulator